MLYKSLCERCCEETIVRRMSMFNTQMCCLKCIAKEKEHPMYETAKRIEREQIKKGNYNFEGIGKPNDL